MKTLLILIDGMRPDAMVQIPTACKVMEKACYTLEGTTVFPSCTLPCHMSLFYSRPPLAHGVTSNTYTARVRPKRGLWETLRAAKKKTAMFYSWEELRDLAKPGSITDTCFISGDVHGWAEANQRLTDRCIEYMNREQPDFAFLYLGAPDAAGHRYGWMSGEYMAALEQSWDCAQQALAALPKDYAVIITADHGGHDKRHTTFMKEDMTIPMLLLNSPLSPGKNFGNVNIMDIAPTVATLLGVQIPMEWKGRSLIRGRTFQRINENICRMTCPYKTIFTTVWTIRTPEGVILMDAASYENDALDHILPFLAEAGVAREEIRYVFISHNHTDHAGGLGGLLRELPNVTVVSRSEKLAQTYPATKFLNPQDGDILAGCMQVVTIPGHTADCAGLLDRRTDTLLAGDCLQLYGICGNEDWGSNISITGPYLEAVEKVRTMKIQQLLTAHDYYPSGYRADGAAAVQKALDDCVDPLKAIGRMIRENPDLDDEAICKLYNAQPVLPTVKLHVVSGVRKAGI